MLTVCITMSGVTCVIFIGPFHTHTGLHTWFYWLWFYLGLQSPQPVVKVSVFCQMCKHAIHSKKKKGGGALGGQTLTLVYLIQLTVLSNNSTGGGCAYLADIRLSLSESLLFCILFCAVRKSSFWMVSHVISLLAAFPLSCNTRRNGFCWLTGFQNEHKGHWGST